MPTKSIANESSIGASSEDGAYTLQWPLMCRLEVDLLLGSFASEFVMGFTAQELEQYEAILNLETIDIFNYISGKDAVPKVRAQLSSTHSLGA